MPYSRSTLKASMADQRRLPTGTVTFLFTDIEGSTPLWEQMPEAMQVAVAQHHSILNEAIKSNGGSIFQVVGDAFQAGFRQATDALCAALAGQRALLEAHWGPTGPIRVRMGLHTGPAELDPSPGPGGAPEYAVGHTLNRSARVMAAGHGGQILVSQETAHLIERSLPEGVALKDLGLHRLKGMQRLEHLYQVTAPGLPDHFPPLATTLERPNNLPAQLTSFIGREKEIDAVIRLLNDYRLVTLNGSGGTGKTRLSLEVAALLLDSFEHGAWLVELAPLSDPDLVMQAVASTFRLNDDSGRPLDEVLGSYLHGKKLLLVLDNCEHLIDACARLAEWILRRASGVKVLASSGEALGIAGEAAYRVPSLSLPADGRLTDLEQSEAGRLFAERAAAAQPGFTLTQANSAAVAQICRRLDGIALAIELAASRVRVMGVEQIAARLDDRFRLLTGGSRTALPRQQTLRATIDWSYSLLTEEERSLLRRLSVFAGGWTLEAAEAICPNPEGGLEAYQVLDGLASLVNKSLVQMDTLETGEARYRLLETVRQYAREQLLTTSDGETLRDRHLAYFANWAEQAYEGLGGRDFKDWLSRCNLEVDNLRSAMEWGLQRDRNAGLRLASSIGQYFFYSNRSPEARRWLGFFLDPPDVAYPPELHIQALARSAFLLDFQYVDWARQAANQCIDLCQGKIEPPAKAFAVLGWASYVDQDLPKMQYFLDEAEKLASKQKDWSAFRGIMHTRARYYIGVGESENAQRYFEEQLKFSTMSGNPLHIAGSKSWLGWLRMIRGDLAGARQMLEEAFQTYKDLGLALHSSSLGAVAMEQGDYAAAQSYFQEYAQKWLEDGLIAGFLEGLLSQADLAFCVGEESHARSLYQQADQVINGTSDQGSKYYHMASLELAKEYYRLLLGRSLTWEGDYEQAAETFGPLPNHPIDIWTCESWIFRGELAVRLGQLDQADDLLRQVLAFTYKNRDRLGINTVLEPFVDLFFRKENPERAARIIGATDAFREKAGRPMYPRFKPYYDNLRQQICDRLGADEFERIYTAGQAQSLDQAAEELLREA